MSPDMRNALILVVVNLAIISAAYFFLVGSSQPVASSAAQAKAIVTTATATSTLVDASSTPAPQPTSSSPTAETVAVPTPTLVPQATPSSAPTITPRPANALTATPLATPEANSAAALLQLVSQQEASLRSGQLSAVLSLGTPNSSVAEVIFDLGSAEPRLRSLTTYTGTKGARIVEFVTIGSKAWQRQQDGAWGTAQEEEGAAGRLRDYLPGASAAGRATLQGRGQRVSTLRWYDAARDADVTLEVDSGSGIPLHLSRVTRGTKASLTISYVGWNTAVEINPPNGS